jgi:aldose 1-epimerase
MFVIEKVDNNNALLDHFHVFNKNTSFKIFPNLGASLQELIFDDVSVIDGIEISEKGILDYQNSFKSSLLFPFPGRIENGKYTYNQQLYQLKLNETNRLNAIHGLVYDKSFLVDSYKAHKNKANLILSYVSDGKLEGFPFKFKLFITYLITEHGLQLSFDVENLGQDSFPFGMGWHPYFDPSPELLLTAGAQHRNFNSENLQSCSLSFSSEKQLVCDENLIPKKTRGHTLKPTFDIDEQFFDDCFILSNNKLRFNPEKYALTMKLGETADTFLQLFTPSERRSIAIEPMTCNPDVFHTEDGLKVLQSGANFHWQVDLNFKKMVEYIPFTAVVFL